MVKRFFDLFFALPSFFILSPLFCLIAIAVRIDTPGPVFFKQKRMGRNFVPFHIFKFRTMIHDAEKRGLSITSGNDTRITKIGKYLRKAKLDELPQIINVVRGDMSLVGPRPEVGKYVEHYSEDYAVILQVRPGITDISSIKYRDEEGVLKRQNDPETYYIESLLPEKINLAKDYIHNRSVIYDLKLIFQTFKKILQV